MLGRKAGRGASRGASLPPCCLHEREVRPRTVPHARGARARGHAKIVRVSVESGGLDSSDGWRESRDGWRAGCHTPSRSTFPRCYPVQAVTPSTGSAEQNDTVSFTYTVYNPGPTPSGSASCKAISGTHPPGYTPLPLRAFTRLFSSCSTTILLSAETGN